MVKYKQARWEKAYEDFKKTNKDDMVLKMAAIQKEQAQLKDGSEYAKKKKELEDVKKALKEYENIEKNVAKIENILAFKKQLVNNTIGLVERMDQYENDNEEVKRMATEIANLDAARKKAVDRVNAIETELKKPNLKDEDKARLNAEKQEKLGEIQDNDLKYSNMVPLKESKEAELQGFDYSKAQNELLKNEQLLAKCDLIGANLVKGKGKEDIGAALSKFKFTPNKDFAKKIKAMKEMQKGEEEPHRAETTAEAFERAIREKMEHSDRKTSTVTGDEPKVTGETLPIENDSKKISKFRKFLKKVFDNIKNKLSRNNRTKNPELEVKPVEPGEKTVEPGKKPVEPEVVTDDKSAFEYTMKHLDGRNDDEVLKKVADLSMRGFKDSVRVDLTERRKQMKQKAADELAKKYGGKYTEQDGAKKPEDEGR